MIPFSSPSSVKSISMAYRLLRKSFQVKRAGMVLTALKLGYFIIEKSVPMEFIV
jgi:hypothetical protein